MWCFQLSMDVPNGLARVVPWWAAAVAREERQRDPQNNAQELLLLKAPKKNSKSSFFQKLHFSPNHLQNPHYWFGKFPILIKYKNCYPEARQKMPVQPQPFTRGPQKI